MNSTELSEEELITFVFEHIDHTKCVGHCIFNAKLTETILRNSSDIKLTCKAKKLFAHSMSSIAEEILEDVLTRTSYITTLELQQACRNLQLPFGDESEISMSVSIQRLLNKYRSLCKFSITNDAKASLKSTLHSVMRCCANQIHTHRSKRKTIDDSDVARVTDLIVVVRNYDTKHVESRTMHARKRYRKPDGRF